MKLRLFGDGYLFGGQFETRRWRWSAAVHLTSWSFVRPQAVAPGVSAGTVGPVTLNVWRLG